MANGIDSDSHLASCCWVVSKSGITSYTQMERGRDVGGKWNVKYRWLELVG